MVLLERMMKISTKTTYALKAMLDLAQSGREHPERLPVIAERQEIPLPYLEQIFSKLKNAGLVQASRGPQGGYQLTKNPDEITLAEVVTILEGPIAPVLCSQPQNRSDHCHDTEGCASRSVCNELDGAVLQVLSQNTLGKMMSEAERLKSRPIRFAN
jgi:Rrf2 family cysteine metabolism transcriptional repressor